MESGPAGRILIALVLGALACTPVAGADMEPHAVFDLFVPIPLDKTTFAGGCGLGDPSGLAEGTFSVDVRNRTFRFSEPSSPAMVPVDVRGGQTSCGTATVRMPVPVGTDHVHVRFSADRSVDELDAGLGYSFVQELRLAPADAPLVPFPYFKPDEGPRAATAFDPPSAGLGAGVDAVTVSWYFEDLGQAPAGWPGGLPLEPSAQVYASSVLDPVFEASGVPAQHDVRHRHAMRGEHAQKTTEVRVEVDASLLGTSSANVRVEVDPGLRLSHVVTPDGAVIADLAANPTAGTADDARYGPVGRLPVIEPRPDFYRATLPGEAVAAHGPGTYTFVFVEESAIRIHPVLLPVATAALLVPLVFALLAAHGANEFRKAAFGNYRKAAAALAAGVLLVMLYYAAVLVEAAQHGGLRLMAHWPLQGTALLLYLHSAVAVAAFVCLGVAGRRLRAITMPSG